MKIGVIGGGLMGMVAAYELAQRQHEVTVLEQGAHLGGLNGSLAVDDGLTIARYQPAVMPGDQHLRSLYAELGLAHELVFRPARVGFVHNGRLHGMSTIWSFLAFAPLGLADRLRLGRTVATALRMQDWAALETVSARDWLTRLGGHSVFERIWAPLLEAKFDGVYSDIPATYVWSWLQRAATARGLPRMQMSLAMPLRGHETLVTALAAAVQARGGSILTHTRVREIEVGGGQFQRVRTYSDTFTFDALVVALPTPDFERLIPGADDAYRAHIARSRYLGLICPALLLDRPLSPYRLLNLTDPSSPFSSIVELPPAPGAAYHVVYLPKYTAPDSDWMGVSDAEIRDAWLLRLRQIFPDLRPSEVLHFAVSRSRYADPVHFLNAGEALVPVETPYDGLYLANTSQVYPELPVSNAIIAHARRVAQLVSQQRPRELAFTAA